MSKLGTWSTTAGNNNSTPPDGWPEGQAPSTVNDCAREMMAAIRSVFNDSQYFDQNLTPTYISATTFSVAGDQTSAIHAGRRLKLYDGTTIYATVVTASYTAVTTIGITADSSNLTSSLSSFAIAILSPNNNSLPHAGRNLPKAIVAVNTGGGGVYSLTTANSFNIVSVSKSATGVLLINFSASINNVTPMLSLLNGDTTAVKYLTFASAVSSTVLKIGLGNVNGSAADLATGAKIFGTFYGT